MAVEPDCSIAVSSTAYERHGARGIVKLFDSGTHNGDTWVMLEALTGQSLTSYWGESDRPSPPLGSVDETLQVARTISGLHKISVHDGRIPRLDLVVGKNAVDALGWLADNGYGDLLRDPESEAGFARDAYSCPSEEAVVLIGEPFAANAMRNPNGTVTLIDPTPRYGSAGFDGAFWVAHTAHPTNLGPGTEAWLTGEPELNVEKFGRLFASELKRHAGVLEVVKRETGQNWQTRDPETVALVTVANGLADVVEPGFTTDDLLQVVEQATASLSQAPTRLNRATDTTSLGGHGLSQF